MTDDEIAALRAAAEAMLKDQARVDVEAKTHFAWLSPEILYTWHAAASPAAVLALLAERETLLAALRLADAAMQHMGDVLNNMDAVTDEDVAMHAPAFEAVSAALAESAAP